MSEAIEAEVTETAVAIRKGDDAVSLGMLRADSAPALVAQAGAVASALADVIERQGLFSMIQGKKYVRVEGWTTLTAMLGCVPREVANEQTDDGSYRATVELVKMRDGSILTSASAECGMDEPRWAGMPRYARRSMAATRATGKACRLAFSWIVAMAGYEPTPAEEMMGVQEQRQAVPQPQPKNKPTAAPPQDEPKDQDALGIVGRLLAVDQRDWGGKPYWVLQVASLAGEEHKVTTFDKNDGPEASAHIDTDVVVKYYLDKKGRPKLLSCTPVREELPL